MQVGLITMQTTNHQNGEHVPRRHKLICFAHQACRDLGIVYWRPRQRGVVLDQGPEFDLAEVEPTYRIGDHDKLEADEPSNSTQVRLSAHGSRRRKNSEHGSHIRYRRQAEVPEDEPIPNGGKHHAAAGSQQPDTSALYKREVIMSETSI
jgi:hypothetical protein